MDSLLSILIPLAKLLTQAIPISNQESVDKEGIFAPYCSEQTIPILSDNNSQIS